MLTTYWDILGSYHALSSTRHFDDLPRIAEFVRFTTVII